MCTMLQYFCNATVHNHALPSCYSQTIRWKTVRSTSKLQFIEQKSSMTTKQWGEKQWKTMRSPSKLQFLKQKSSMTEESIVQTNKEKSCTWTKLKNELKNNDKNRSISKLKFVSLCTSLYFNSSCRTNFLSLWPEQI